MANDFLPIGSVVQLAESSALVMIAGYLPIMQSKPDYIWDYSGFRFPIGYTDDESIYCFDQEQIETVYARGYQDVEEEIFTARLGEAQRRLTQRADGKEPGEEEE